MQGNYWLAEDMLASQEGLCSMDVVIAFRTGNYYVWRPCDPQAENVWETLPPITNNCSSQ